MKKETLTNLVMVFLALIVPAVILSGCGAKTGDKELSFAYNFSEGEQGWVGDFSDLHKSMKENAQLEFGLKELPAELGEGKGLYISGSNISDDLFMFLKKGLSTSDGIKPNTTYSIVYEIDLGTNVAGGLVGIGGAPGESVYFKVGASAMEPVIAEEGDGSEPFLRLNIDKGNQSSGGKNAIVIGNIAKEDSDDETYEIKTLTNKEQPVQATSDNDGNLWLLFGTDSGFEGITSLYYTGVRVNLTVAE